MRSSLIQATLADVANPLHHIMVTVVELGLKDLQVAHLQARAGKRDLDRERWRRGGGGEEEEERREEESGEEESGRRRGGWEHSRQEGGVE